MNLLLKRNGVRGGGYLLWPVLAVVCLLFAAGQAMAQIDVSLSTKRDLFVSYEPILMTVSIKNNSGHDLDLTDTASQKWFSFQIDTDEGRPIAPNDPNYSNPPIHIAAGDSATRVVNITPLYPVSDFGTYRISASVYSAQDNRYFSSPSTNIQVTEGHAVWQKTVGVPDGETGAGTTRTVTLMTHRLPDATMLYLRIEDKDAGIIYCTYQLGRFVAFGTPQVLFDAQNHVHVLHNSAPKSFLYSHIGLNGEVIDRKEFQELSSRPMLAKTPDGTVEVVGGVLFDPNAKVTQDNLPTLNDRPVALPTPQSTGKSEPSDKPKNLLSQ